MAMRQYGNSIWFFCSQFFFLLVKQNETHEAYVCSVLTDACSYQLGYFHLKYLSCLHFCEHFFLSNEWKNMYEMSLNHRQMWVSRYIGRRKMNRSTTNIISIFEMFFLNKSSYTIMVWMLLFCWIALNSMQQSFFLFLFSHLKYRIFAQFYLVICTASTRYESNFFSNLQTSLHFLFVLLLFLFRLPRNNTVFPLNVNDIIGAVSHWWNNSIAFHVFFCAILFCSVPCFRVFSYTRKKTVIEKAELYLFYYLLH